MKKTLVKKFSAFRLAAALLAAAFAVCGVSCKCGGGRPAPETAAGVDIPRYMGVWHEIARLPTPFQRGTFDARAQYELAEDGTVKITNTSRGASGKTSAARASAYIPDPAQPAKLRVSFFWPFYGDYWILALGPDYQWALVGTPDFRYLWLLSRSPQMPRAQAMQILSRARDLGFDISPVIFNEDFGAPAQGAQQQRPQNK